MPGMESEGMAGTPLNEAQIANVVRVIQEVSALTGRRPQRNPALAVPPGVLALVEHRECIQWGAAATACPSNRYPWPVILSRLEGPKGPVKEEEDMPTPVWATLKDRPPNVGFKSYLLFVTKDGLTSRFVPNATEHNALGETRAAGELLGVSLETLRAFGAHPDPLE